MMYPPPPPNEHLNSAFLVVGWKDSTSEYGFDLCRCRGWLMMKSTRSRSPWLVPMMFLQSPHHIKARGCIIYVGEKRSQSARWVLESSVIWLALWAAPVIAWRYWQPWQNINLAWGALMHQHAAPEQTSTWWSPRPFQVGLQQTRSLANLSKLCSYLKSSKQFGDTVHTFFLNSYSAGGWGCFLEKGMLTMKGEHTIQFMYYLEKKAITVCVWLLFEGRVHFNRALIQSAQLLQPL